MAPLRKAKTSSKVTSKGRKGNESKKEKKNKIPAAKGKKSSKSIKSKKKNGKPNAQDPSPKRRGKRGRKSPPPLNILEELDAEKEHAESASATESESSDDCEDDTPIKEKSDIKENLFSPCSKKRNTKRNSSPVEKDITSQSSPSPSPKKKAWRESASLYNDWRVMEVVDYI
mmetsp:Transcript_70/g.125  ORF Transcript_70/g.125 Transcript_70/m.125 type:complete len:172 (+) Transcript_70:65-580(+)